MEWKYVTYLLFSLIFFIDNLLSERKYFPNLPFGEYRLKFRGAFICNESINYPISENFHLSRISKTKTVLTGKLITRIPFDDSLTFDVNLAVLDKIGGWKPNAFVYRQPNACSTFKKFLGEAWTPYLNSFNASLTDCPIKIGNYTMNSFDISLLEKGNLPKSFFYGTYKSKLQYINQNDNTVSCLIIVLEFVRPWENNL